MGKLSGVEAVEALPSSVRRNNQIMAVGLAGFVGYVFYYSMASVGKTAGPDSEDPIAKLESEAQEARTKKQRQAITDQEAADLANLDMGVADKDMEGVELAVAAPDDIATLEESRNKKAAGGKSERSLLNKIVFFWR